METSLLDSIPVPIIFILIVLLILLSNEVGYRIGMRARKRYAGEMVATQGPLVGGLLGMLAFVLAFTFSMAASHHDQRKKFTLQEANVIGTAYLRADLLPPKHRQEIKKLLREYVDVRLRGAKDDAYLAEAIKRSLEIHGLLWQQVLEASQNADIRTGLVIQSINDLIDMHENRIEKGIYTKIPGSVWFALFAISAFTMVTIGIQIGFVRTRGLLAIVPLSLAFAVLATLVIDLDNPGTGFIKEGQYAMEDLQSTMKVKAQ